MKAGLFPVPKGFIILVAELGKNSFALLPVDVVINTGIRVSPFFNFGVCIGSVLGNRLVVFLCNFCVKDLVLLQPASQVILVE